VIERDREIGLECTAARLHFGVDQSVGVAVRCGAAGSEVVPDEDHLVLVPGPTGSLSRPDILLLCFITAEYRNHLTFNRTAPTHRSLSVDE